MGLQSRSGPCVSETGDVAGQGSTTPSGLSPASTDPSRSPRAAHVSVHDAESLLRIAPSSSRRTRVAVGVGRGAFVRRCSGAAKRSRAVCDAAAASQPSAARRGMKLPLPPGTTCRNIDDHAAWSPRATGRAYGELSRSVSDVRARARLTPTRDDRTSTISSVRLMANCPC